MAENNKTKITRRLKGIVVGDKMDKTIVVKVARTRIHPKYKKMYKVTKSYKVHDEKNSAEKGQNVIFEECRPLSKQKRWRLVQIIKK